MPESVMSLLLPERSWPVARVAALGSKAKEGPGDACICDEEEDSRSQQAAAPRSGSRSGSPAVAL